MFIKIQSAHSPSFPSSSDIESLGEGVRDLHINTYTHPQVIFIHSKFCYCESLGVEEYDVYERISQADIYPIEIECN